MAYIGLIGIAVSIFLWWYQKAVVKKGWFTERYSGEPVRRYKKPFVFWSEVWLTRILSAGTFLGSVYCLWSILPPPR